VLRLSETGILHKLQAVKDGYRSDLDTRDSVVSGTGNVVLTKLLASFSDGVYMLEQFY
jgi:hypothetical protein